MEAKWQRGRWWRVIGPDGEIWCETSSDTEARESMRPGDVLYKEWVLEQVEWREVD